MFTGLVMEEGDQSSLLEEFAMDSINSRGYPDAIHTFIIYTCISCGSNVFRLTVEHHTGSAEGNFRGIILGECSACGYLMRLFTFTGEHRKHMKNEWPECDCGNRNFLSGQCERIEGEMGIPGFFDEGVIVGRCASCHRNRVIVYTD
ncbi:MAG: hypothetical protein AB9888_04785 [Bacteroidales bacterium]